MTASSGRTIGRVVAFGIPVGLFLSLAACVVDDGPTGLVILQDQLLDTGTACTVPGTATPDRRTRGVLDVTVLDKNYTGYYLYPLVENLLASFTGLADSTTTGGVEEKNDILMESFHVKLDAATSAGTTLSWDSGCPGEFDVPADSSLLVPGGTVSGVVEIIRPATRPHSSNICKISPPPRSLSQPRFGPKATWAAGTSRARPSDSRWTSATAACRPDIPTRSLHSSASRRCPCARTHDQPLYGRSVQSGPGPHHSLLRHGRRRPRPRHWRRMPGDPTGTAP